MGSVDDRYGQHGRFERTRGLKDFGVFVRIPWYTPSLLPLYVCTAGILYSGVRGSIMQQEKHESKVDPKFRKAYETPRLKHFGRLEELVQADFVGGSDGSLLSSTTF